MYVYINIYIYIYTYIVFIVNVYINIVLYCMYMIIIIYMYYMHCMYVYIFIYTIYTIYTHIICTYSRSIPGGVIRAFEKEYVKPHCSEEDGAEAWGNVWLQPCGELRTTLLSSSAALSWPTDTMWCPPVMFVGL